MISYEISLSLSLVSPSLEVRGRKLNGEVCVLVMNISFPIWTLGGGMQISHLQAEQESKTISPPTISSNSPLLPASELGIRLYRGNGKTHITHFTGFAQLYAPCTLSATQSKASNSVMSHYTHPPSFNAPQQTHTPHHFVSVSSTFNSSYNMSHQNLEPQFLYIFFCHTVYYHSKITITHGLGQDRAKDNLNRIWTCISH